MQVSVAFPGDLGDATFLSGCQVVWLSSCLVVEKIARTTRQPSTLTTRQLDIPITRQPDVQSLQTNGNKTIATASASRSMAKANRR